MSALRRLLGLSCTSDIKKRKEEKKRERKKRDGKGRDGKGR
jgi:hypothetical protein